MVFDMSLIYIGSPIMRAFTASITGRYFFSCEAASCRNNFSDTHCAKGRCSSAYDLKEKAAEV